MKNTRIQLESIQAEAIRSESTPSKSLGFTMVEIMVAMVIGLILMAGTIQVFIGNKQTYRTIEASSRLQENARFAMAKLTKDIRMAGFWGCANLTSAVNHVNGGTMNFDEGGIGGTEGGGTNPDSIILRGAIGAGITIDTPYMTTNASALHLANGSGLNQFDILIVSDCVTADAFQISGPATVTDTINHNTGVGTPGNASGNLSKTYAGDASIYRAVEYTYSIATGANGQNALFRTENLGAATELVENIENMQIIYGEDTDSPKNYVANYYGDVDEVTTDNVVSIRFVLTAVSDNNITTVASTNSVTGAADNRLRKTFTATIGVRNYLK